MTKDINKILEKYYKPKTPYYLEASYDLTELFEKILAEQKRLILEEGEGMKKKSGTRTNWICPKCRYFGGKDTFCIYDRRKLVEETESWEEPSDEYYNQAITDYQERIKQLFET